VTEEEARGKWCPFARRAAFLADFDGVTRSMTAVNRSGNLPDEDCRCIASDCMAWRWLAHGHDDGYCGLANPRAP
jgi:hypothetical protein